jgi:hypothetical protein
MPHVKLRKPADLLEIWKSPPAFSYRLTGKDISFNFNNCYVSSDENELLFKWVVAEGRLVQHVFFSLRLEEDFMIMGISKNYPVLRTEGVKLLMAVIASALEDEGNPIISSSLEPFLRDGRFYQRNISGNSAGNNLDRKPVGNI